MINYTKKKKSQAVSSLSFFLYSSSTYLTLLHFFFSTSALPRVSTKLKYSVCIIFNLKQHEFVLIIFLINPLRVSYALRSWLMAGIRWYRICLLQLMRNFMQILCDGVENWFGGLNCMQMGCEIEMLRTRRSYNWRRKLDILLYTHTPA